MKSYSIYGLNGCKMLLKDSSGRFRITSVNAMDDIVNNNSLPLLDSINNIRTYSKKDFKEKYPNSRAQGIVVEFKAHFDQQFDYSCIEKHDYSVVVLSGVKDPQNLGQIIRTCECAGIDSIVLPENRSVAITDTALQISQGSFTGINIHTEKNINRFIDLIKKHGFWVTGFENSVSANNWFDIDMRGRAVFIFGSEGEGIRSLTLKKCDFVGTIPMAGKVNSLNVSASVSAILFERLRQIQIGKKLA